MQNSHFSFFSESSPFPSSSSQKRKENCVSLSQAYSKQIKYLSTYISGEMEIITTESIEEDHDRVVEMESQYYYQKGVKHLSEKGISKLPQKYILPVSERPDIIKPNRNGKPFSENNQFKLPIIDFAELQGSNRSQVLKSLANACEHYGFFQLVNHGNSTDVTRNMMDVSRRLFELPLKEREKYMTPNMYAPVRYGTSFNQTRDGVFCWRDFMKLMCHPLRDVLPHWPSQPMDFRKWGVRYANENKHLFLRLMEAIAESLGVIIPAEKDDDDDDDDTLEQLKDGSQLMVVNYYPACPEPQLTLGMPPHSDYGFLTLLLQDDVEGLQIQVQDRWVTVEPALPNSFVVNVGDHLEIFSNGRYKSVLHRVIVNSTKPRISVACLHSVGLKSMVRPSRKLITEENPRRYMDTDFATFLNYISSCDFKKKNFLESRKIKLSDTEEPTHAKRN